MTCPTRTRSAVAPTVVQVVEVNRVRLLELGAAIEVLAGAIGAGERETDGAELDPVREVLRALRQLAAQPLPEVLMDRTTAVDVELAATVHELEQIAAELERSTYYEAAAIVRGHLPLERRG